jgi:hypothetical protein
MIIGNKDFYPTPSHLIQKMLSKIDFRMISNVLEPSAGSGNIVDAVVDKFKYSHSNYNKGAKWDIDCIEIDENLRYILQGKNYRVIQDDFLTFNTYKRYDLIVANFPFSEDDKHLHKALDIQERTGGYIVCLINADTLRNPFSNSRKDLLRRLEENNAVIEYIENAFMDAERKTSVTVALITINISEKESISNIYNDLKKDYTNREEKEYNNNDIVTNDFVKSIVQQFNFEVELGMKLINEFNFMSSKMLKTFKKEHNSDSVLSLNFNEYDGKKVTLNEFIQKIRLKYWTTLFENKSFTGLLTSNLSNEYKEKVQELLDYDFSEYNIYSIKLEMNKNMLQGAEKSILNLFEKYSNKYHWFDECSKNVHYYNGWRTNKSYVVGKKVIVPCKIYITNDSKYVDCERVLYKKIDGEIESLIDTEKCFNYLDGGITEDISIQEALSHAAEIGQTSKIKCKYFNLTFYKKGTVHIEFTNLDLLQKFNLYGSQRMNWLPPCYGKKAYKDMTTEEKTVIDDFEGEQSYNKVMANKEYYIVETSKLLMLAN